MTFPALNGSPENSGERPPSSVGLCIKAVVLAAGRGTRMRNCVGDKILAPIEGRSSFYRSTDTLRHSGLFTGFIVVYRDEPQKQQLEGDLPPECPPILWTRGGERRQDSVFNGLADAGLDTDYVFIHDCARPLVAPADLHRLWEAVLQDKGATLAHPVTDTIKKVHKRKSRFRRCKLQDLDRRTLWAMETPQAFAYQPIFDAYQTARQGSESHTDDAAVASAAGMKITLVESTGTNPKITRPEDLAYAAFLLRETATGERASSP